tara:strand:+ start:447 stop:1013 length:567 start_codon:yes stop_codon:yes gene_type:complete
MLIELKDHTYEELFEAIKSMTPEQRKQLIQIATTSPDGDEPIPTMPVYAIGTVSSLFDVEVGIRSHYDNRNHLEDVVILADYNPYGEDNAVGMNLLTGEKYYGADGRKLTSKEKNRLYGLGFFPNNANMLSISFTKDRPIVSVRTEGAEIVLSLVYPIDQSTNRARVENQRFTDFEEFFEEVTTVIAD